MEARLAETEGKLKGVYNLGGKLIALERMAAEFGFEIPDLEVRQYSWVVLRVPCGQLWALSELSHGGHCGLRARLGARSWMLWVGR